ncbi:MAG: hypothetical protein D6720_03470 [Gammaproteobacteria bacterium]|nr:MAG: hypothetical protein D6720_03470 [Gammaproteobacteria bacterium]
MTSDAQNKRTLLVAILTLIGIGLLVAIFYSSVWWVSLTAPNYPKESFPQGVRIEFHVNGVFNGCTLQKKAEIQEEEALDCVHEMDTINHYVGMYPIAAGAPIERAFGQFLLTFLAIMLLGFICTKPKIRLAIMGVGFAGLAGWMYLTLFTDNGIAFENKGYIESLVTALDQNAKENAEDEVEIGGIAGALKQSLEESGVEVVLPSQLEKQKRARPSDKAGLIRQLRETYEVDREKSGGRMAPWNGSLLQVMTWHYDKTLGRYFNNRSEIEPMVAKLRTATVAVFWALMAAMLLLLWGARRNGGLLYWLLVLVPMALPVFFVIDYSAWLWWYGHTLNDMGAFTVKPFMPTVFGNGKVAQFTTHSYPDGGFGLMMVFSLLLAVAALIRRKQFKGDSRSS